MTPNRLLSRTSLLVIFCGGAFWLLSSALVDAQTGAQDGPAPITSPTVSPTVSPTGSPPGSPTVNPTGGQPETPERELINCQRYKSKRDNVPVYAEAKTSSRVIARLQLGEFVCYLGEQCLACPGGPYAIADWSRHQLLNRTMGQNLSKSAPGTLSAPGTPSAEDEQPEAVVEIAYVRLVDLTNYTPPPFGPVEQNVYSQASQVLRSMGQGLVPEDIYGPFRPFIDTIHPPTKCRAGKICERVEELQKD